MTTKWTFSCLLAAALLAVPLAHAQKLYKWTDAEGRVTYRDQPPPSDDIKAEEKVLPYSRPAAGGDTTDKVLPPVILYVAPACDSCDNARKYLQQKKVAFTEKNVFGNVELQKELQAKSGALSVPTITVGEKVMKGYLESLLEGELKAAGHIATPPPAAEGEKPAGQ